MGEKEAGTSTLFSCLIKNSRVDGVGGEGGSFGASARIRLRSFRSFYSQTWTHLLSPPSSLYMPAVKGEYFSRWGMASVQVAITLEMAPGW